MTNNLDHVLTSVDKLLLLHATTVIYANLHMHAQQIITSVKYTLFTPLDQLTLQRSKPK